MSRVYAIMYPITLSNESVIANENTGFGITNHMPFIDLVEKIVHRPECRGWRVEYLGFFTKDKAERKYNPNNEDGSVLDIVRGEWKSDGYRRWATAGCM